MYQTGVKVYRPYAEQVCSGGGDCISLRTQDSKGLGPALVLSRILPDYE